MDLSTLASRTRLDRRRLRYVLDHELVPALKIKIVNDESGRPRHFADDVGFGIVCAVTLLDLGLPHETIRQFLTALLDAKLQPTDSQRALPTILASPLRPLDAHADFDGDGCVRLNFAGKDTEWFKPGKKSAPANVAPRVIVRLNIGQIRDLVFSPH